MKDATTDRVALVVPCKDEARRIDTVRFLSAVREYPFLELLFVDDGSSDGTSKVLAAMCAESSSIKMIRLAKNLGKGEAVRAGVKCLLERDTCDIIGFWDADLALPLSALPELLREMRRRGGVAAVGSRRKFTANSPLVRRLEGWVMRGLIRSFRLPISDTQCGAKIFVREVAARIFETPFISRWLFDVELFKRMDPSELAKVAEVFMPDWRYVPGSKLGIADVPNILRDVIRLSRLF